MVIFRAYQYLFYKLCRFQTAVFNPTPALTAFMFLIVLESLNIGTLLFLGEWLFRRALLPPTSNVQALCAAGLLAFPQYFLLLHRCRSEEIAKRFQGESTRRRIIGGTIVAIYALLSFLLLFWSVNLWRGGLAARTI